MVWLYLTLVVCCVALAIFLAAARSRYTVVAVVAAVLSVLAYLTGMSIGFIIAPIALLTACVAVAAHMIRERPLPRR